MAKPESLLPLKTLVDVSEGEEIHLPDELKRLYGNLRFPTYAGYPWVFANFVSTLDGAVTLGNPGHEGGGDISGHNPYDAMIMGILRAVADAVVISAGSLRVSPQHLWTPDFIFPPLKDAYAQLRQNNGNPQSLLHVVVTASGVVDFRLPLFDPQNSIPVLMVTTQEGAARLREAGAPPGLTIRAVKEAGWIDASEILQAIQADKQVRLVLVEAGPHLTGVFLKDHQLDELFLSFAPQVAGRNGQWERLSFTAGEVFAPEDPRWAQLISVKQANDFLFFRYRF